VNSLLHEEHGLSGIEGFSTLPLKTDRTFSDLADLHAGHAILSFSSLDLNRTSKSFPQSLHRNSKIGNCISSEKKEDFGPRTIRKGLKCLRSVEDDPRIVKNRFIAAPQKTSYCNGFGEL
jgi:hypothetical protein